MNRLLKTKMPKPIQTNYCTTLNNRLTIAQEYVIINIICELCSEYVVHRGRRNHSHRATPLTHTAPSPRRPAAPRKASSRPHDAFLCNLYYLFTSYIALSPQGIALFTSILLLIANLNKKKCKFYNYLFKVALGQ